MVQDVLAEISDPDIRVHVVWEPILPTDRASTVPAATRLLPDARATHYWDPDLGLADALRVPLEIEHGVAWDVYLLYDRTSRWPPEGPTPPTDFQHQLHGMPESSRLDATKLNAKLLELLSEARP